MPWILWFAKYSQDYAILYQTKDNRLNVQIRAFLYMRWINRYALSLMCCAINSRTKCEIRVIRVAIEIDIRHTSVQIGTGLFLFGAYKHIRVCTSLFSKISTQNRALSRYLVTVITQIPSLHNIYYANRWFWRPCLQASRRRCQVPKPANTQNLLVNEHCTEHYMFVQCSMRPVLYNKAGVCTGLLLFFTVLIRNLYSSCW